MAKTLDEQQLRRGGLQFFLSRVLDLLTSRFGHFCISVSILACTAFIIWSAFRALSSSLLRDIANSLCQTLGFSLEGVPGDILGNVLARFVPVVAGFLFTYMVRPASLISVLRKYCIPINVHLDDEYVNYFSKYFLKSAAVRIKNLLPSELQPLWDSSVLENSYRLRHSRLLRPRCREQRGENDNASPKIIGDIWRYLDEYLLDAGKVTAPLMVHGEPGSGKSVLLFHLFGERAVQLLRFKGGWIPLFIFAHELTEADFPDGLTFEQFLINYFEEAHRRNPNLGYQDVGKLIAQGYLDKQFLIIIDGLDELPERPRYFHIIQKLKAIIAEDNKAKARSKRPNRCIISCRTDDNPNSFMGAVVELRPLTFAQSKAYLRNLAWFFGRRKSPDPKHREHALNALAGLKASASHSLLRNYMSNPYLLSLISEYYEEGPHAQADWLRDVFHKVLARELRKHYEQATSLSRGSRRAPSDEDVSKLVSHLEDVIGPFCFERTYNTGHIEMSQPLFFQRALQKGLGIGKCLFGADGQPGALELYFNDPSSSEANRVLVHAVEGPIFENASHFLDELKRLRQQQNLDEYRSEVCQLLYRNALRWLREARLAEVEMAEGAEPRIKRFRHRRMGEYFAAKCLDGNQTALQLIVPNLENAWLRDPLRIFAAVANDPTPLLDSCIKRCEQISQDARKVIDVLVNAGAAVEYLPRREYADRQMQQRLQQACLRVGTTALKSAHHPPATGIQKALDDCLTVVQQVYAAEWLTGLKAEEKKSLFASDVLPGLNDWIARSIRRYAMKRRYEQMDAYRKLWPVKEAISELRVSRATLFWLVANAAPFFRDDYRDVIEDTHRTPLSRVPARTAMVTQWSLSCSIVLWLLGTAFVSFGPLLEQKLMALAIVLVFMFVCAGTAQMLAIMDLRQSYKLVLWLLVSGLRKIWAWSITRGYPREDFEERSQQTSAAKDKPASGWIRAALVVSLIAVFIAATGFSAKRWVVPMAYGFAVRHQIKAVQKDAQEIAAAHEAYMQNANAVGATPSSQELKELSDGLKAHIAALEALQSRAIKVNATTNGATQPTAPAIDVIPQLESEVTQAKDSLILLDQKGLDLLKVQSAVEQYKKVTTECAALLSEGAELLAMKDRQLSDTEAESQMDACNDWLSSVSQSSWKLELPPEPIQIPGEDLSATAKASLAELNAMKDSLWTLAKAYETQIAPSKEFKRVSANLEIARSLTDQGQALASALETLKTDDFAELTENDNAADIWLTKARSAQDYLNSASLNLIPPSLASEIPKAKTQLSNAQERVATLREPLKEKIRQFHYRQRMDEIDAHTSKGKEILARTEDWREMSFEPLAEELGAWAQQANPMMQELAASSNAQQEAISRVNLSDTYKAILERKASVESEIAQAESKRKAARDAEDRKLAAVTDANALLDGPEWKTISSDLGQCNLPFSKYEQTLASSAAQLNNPNATLREIERYIDVINKIDEQTARLDALKSALGDYSRRVDLQCNEMSSSEEIRDSKPAAKLRARQLEVQTWKEYLDKLDVWLKDHPTDTLGQQLKTVEETIKSEMARHQHETSKRRMAVIVAVPSTVLIILISLVCSSPFWNGILTKVPDEFDALGRFFERRGYPLSVAMKAADRLDRVVQKQLADSQDRKLKAGELFDRMHVIVNRASRKWGHTADRITIRLKQIIEELNTERNR